MATGMAGGEDEKGQGMKRSIKVLAVAAAMTALSTGTALATSEPLSVFNGTAEGDYIKGTAKADTINGLGGDDALHGLGGDDTLWGDAGHDGLYGGPGSDTIYSAGDGRGDLVDCGSGYDSVVKGPDTNLDRFVNCEYFGSLPEPQ